MPTRRLAAAAGLTVLFAGASRAAEPKPDELDWIKKNAIPLTSCEAGRGFDDLQSVKALIGDARIVSLGECTHGTREVFQMKHRLVEFLASEMGFTIFSIEANMPEAYQLNEFVLHGRGDPEELINGMYFWTWNTEEVRDMVVWMRDFNRSGQGRIEFTGFDMQTPDVAMRIVLDLLENVDAERHAQVKELYAACANVNSSGSGGRAFGVATATLPVDQAKGKKLRYIGWIRTKDVTRPFAGLWCRVDGPTGVLAFDNMHSRGVTGTTEWKEYVIELEVPNEATNINFGAQLPGDGTAWFDGLRIELDGRPFVPGDGLDLDFEGDAPAGFYTSGEGYTVAMDATTAQSGKQSLRMHYRSARADAGLKASEAATRCRQIVAELESNREAYAKSANPNDVDWAIQNARVVHQCMQMHAGEVQRDESMARNVKWILDHAPANAKIVLWAHNGHVSTSTSFGGAAMGAYLEEWYGRGHVVIGFAAGEGEYTAVVQGKGLRSNNQLQPPKADSIENFFRRSGIPMFLLDLRMASADDPASAWLKRGRPFRSIGSVAMDAQFPKQDVTQAFDALIYIDDTSATRLIRRAGGRN